MRHSSQPVERPDAAFQPAPLQVEPWYWISQGWSSCHPSGQLSPVLELVWPFWSGAVTHVSAATSWISTNTKSQLGSVSYENRNVMSPPPATITVSATATDTDGTVASVEFRAGTTVIGTDTTSPYSVSWSNVPAGTYTLTAIARDDAGATTTSA